MKFQKIIHTVLLFFALCLCSGLAAPAQEKLPKGKIKVVDGDTISVRFKTGEPLKIRFAAIDAPEKKQTYGAKCANKLKKLLKGDEMRIESFGTDRYGRTLARIWLDNIDVNLQMVEIGCAWIYDGAKILPPAQRADYLKAFESARNEKRGLFSKENPVEPKEYRKRK